LDNIIQDIPNLTPETVPVQNSTGLDAIAQKMAAMRNQNPATIPTETGAEAQAKAQAPVAPEGSEVLDDDTNLVQPEVAEPEAEYEVEGNEEPDAPEEVSTEDTSQAEVIDFLEFAEAHPDAKFKFMRNGKEIEIDAKKAAAILGQGAAISEDARQLKIEKAEFDEYKKVKQSETEGLFLAMEFTVRPQLQKAYDEIIKVQQYQNVFKQQLAQTQDPAQQAQIQANMQQNQQYLEKVSATVNQLKPRVEQFYQMRSNQVREVLEANRKAFQDKELRNTAIYEEVRDKVAKGWDGAKSQLVPGVDNLDLISSDEHILGLLRDGLKYRDRPKAKSSGSSIAALTSRKGSATIASGGKDEITQLREKARAGDKQAQDNLLVAQMKALRGQRK